MATRHDNRIGICTLDHRRAEDRVCVMQDLSLDAYLPELTGGYFRHLCEQLIAGIAEDRHLEAPTVRLFHVSSFVQQRFSRRRVVPVLPFGLSVGVSREERSHVQRGSDVVEEHLCNRRSVERHRYCVPGRSGSDLIDQR